MKIHIKLLPLLSLCGMLFVTFPASAISNSYYIKKLDVSNGLSDMAVYGITQDGLGRIWFGTSEGLNCYDGKDIKSYYSNVTDIDNSTKGTFIERMINDKEGNVYAVQNNSLIKYNIHSDSFEKLCEHMYPGVLYHNDEIYYTIDTILYQYNTLSSKKRAHTIGSISTVTSIVRDNQKLYIGTTNGLCIFSYDSNNRLKFRSKILNNRIITSMLLAQNNILYIGTNEQLYTLSNELVLEEFKASNNYSSLELSNNNIRQLNEDKDGNIWFGSPTGVCKIEPSSKTVSKISFENKKSGLSHPYICSLFFDRENTLWLGSESGGVNYFSPFDYNIQYFISDISHPNSINSPFLTKICYDNSGRLWIASEKGINILDLYSGDVKHITKENYPDIYDNSIKCIEYCSELNIVFFSSWCGGVSYYDIDKDKIYNYKIYDTLSEKNLKSIVHQIKLYGDELIVRTATNIYSFNIKTEQTRVIADGIKLEFHIKEDKLWYPEKDQIYCHDLIDRDSVYNIDLSKYGFKNCVVNGVFINSQNKVCCTTRGAGVLILDIENETVEQYSVSNGRLTTDYVYYIEELPSKNLLVTTKNGFSLINLQNNSSRHIDLVSTGIISAISIQNGIEVDNNGRISISGIGGLVSFFEEDLYKESDKAELVFSKLYLNNSEVSVGDKNNILSINLPYTKRIELKHKQNNFSIEFAYFSYINVLNAPNYQYKLEGFDDDWINTSTMRANYTNISPGRYTLHVRQINTDYSQNSTISLPITIRKPWYNSSIAWIVYILSLFGSIYRFNRNRSIRNKLKYQAEKERLEKERLNEVMSAKLQFFANVSHEFRTPLTLIINQIDILTQNNQLSRRVSESISKIKKNAKLMNGLITELLDFRKAEQNHIGLSIAPYNLTDLINEIYYSFYDLSIQHSIKYSIQIETKETLCYVDLWQIKKVFFNLLSNAFKCTPDNGEIKIVVTENNDLFNISIIDSGIGLTQDECSKVFDRFYQVKTNLNNNTNRGTGIGLALTMTIVEMHRGEIVINSKKNIGSEFRVVLKKGQQHFDGVENIQFIEPIEVNAIEESSFPNEKEVEEINKTINESTEIKDNKILLIDDNRDVLHILEKVFAPYYNIVIAEDGISGLEVAKNENPDLIISDVMMPGMNGIELCDKIKTDIELSHIPVVLLTALDNIETSIEGYRKGADDYISKPFDVKLLLLKCTNIIRGRKAAKKNFAKSTETDITMIASTPLDRKLLEDITSVIESNISDEDFDVNTLCRELGMSRTNVFKKFKSLMGVTPNDFILKIRLNRSVNILMNNPDKAIVDIACELGFNSASYFSKCFKKMYNLTPVEYRKSKSHKN